MRLNPLLMLTGIILPALLTWPSPAPCQDMTRQDRFAMLYSSRFTFTREGVPLVNVAIMDGQREAQVSSKSAVRVWTDAVGGPSVAFPGGRKLQVTIVQATAAEVRYWVIVAQVPINSPDAERLARQWRDKGLTVKLFEEGALFGVAGHRLDSRRTLVTVGGGNQAQAGSLLERLMKEKLAVPPTLYPEVVHLPHGTIRLTDGAVTLEAKDYLVLESPGQDTLDVERVEFGTGQAWHGFQDRSYWGQVILAVDSRGQLALVNAVPADKLLMGLVPAEIFASSPEEALRAQAISARCVLLAKIGTRHFLDPYLLCSDQHCQVYKGAGQEKARTTKAVKATRGEVMLDTDGRLVYAVYSSCCGGHTEHIENVWDKPADPVLRGRPDSNQPGTKGPWANGVSEDRMKEFLQHPFQAFCRLSSFNKGHFRWTRTLPSAKVDQLVSKAYGRQVGHVQEIKVLDRGVSGRVKEVLIRGQAGQVTVRREFPVRKLFGGLRSGMFVVEAQKDGQGRAVSFTFRGGGFGHGVGMCQIGAIGMAEEGFDYKSILKHYYMGARVERIY